MFERVKRLFTISRNDGQVQKQLDQLKARLPAPVFWLFGKTQSGKTSVVKFLTGAGFEHARVRALPVEANAKGPALFAAIATRS